MLHRNFTTTEPANQNDAEATQTDLRRHDISSAGRIEMKVTETPASVPPAARTRGDLRTYGGDEARSSG